MKLTALFTAITRFIQQSLPCALLIAGFATNLSAFDLTPGVFREYTISTRNYNGNADAWRVTDPGATNPGAIVFLPNQIFTFEDIDLSNAVRVDLLMHHWTGHLGTTGQQVIVNGTHTLDLPKTISSTLNDSNQTFQLPLDWIKQGSNTLQGTISLEEQGKHWWGQWGWYWIKIRVWISEESSTIPNGTIVVHAPNKIITENSVELTFEANGTISSVEYFKKFDGFDSDGNGKTYDWQGFLDQIVILQQREPPAPPFSSIWDVSGIPDQKPGAVSFIALIKKGNEYRITEPVHGYSIQRDYSVKMFTPFRASWPTQLIRNHVVGRTVIDIPAEFPLEELASARILMRSWNGQANEEGSTSIALNSNNPEDFKTGIITGASHVYAFDDKELTPLDQFDFVSGKNSLYLTAKTEHHGCEVLNPGPCFLLRWDRWITEGWYLGNVKWLYYVKQYAPWIWSDDFGWIYQLSPRRASGWNYNPIIGYFWANLDTYPYIYLHNQKKWVQLESSDENGFTFLDAEAQPLIIPNNNK